jgi:hypothetical protein
VASIGSLTFDLGEAALHEEDEYTRIWMTTRHVVVCLRYHPGPPDWPFDLTDAEAAHAFYQHQSADLGGVMLALEPTRAAGVEALRGLFKYGAPIENSRAMYYVGILWVPFQTGNFQVNVEAMESGTTGGREAAVCVLLGDAWPMPEGEPVRIESLDELKALDAAPVRVFPSDDEKYDADFPEHPLSRVRSTLAHVLDTAVLDTAARADRPFRIGRA